MSTGLFPTTPGSGGLTTIVTAQQQAPVILPVYIATIYSTNAVALYRNKRSTAGVNANFVHTYVHVQYFKGRYIPYGVMTYTVCVV